MKSSVSLVLAVLLLASCKSTTPPPLRGDDDAAPAMTLKQLEGRKDVDDGTGVMRCSDPVLRTRVIEHFKNTKGKDFYVGVIELSDDGHVSDFDRERKVFDKLAEVAIGNTDRNYKNSPGAVVVTFVHGWHHGGKVCDNNLACFRRVLQALSEAETRPVFGVYLGWRGERFHDSVGSAVSFYNRKSTAHLIGHEGGREVLLRLDQLCRDLNDDIRHANPNGARHPVTMVTAGHSFGGALVYSAVEGALVRELAHVKSEEGKRPPGSEHVVGLRQKCGVRPVRPGIGDLVILVNPAFEARRYQYFAADLAGDRVHYANNQLPVLLTVASEADGAVKYAFPAGRSLYFVFHPWRLRGMSDIIGAGHYDPQTTHDLIVANAEGKEIHPGAAKSEPTTPADEDTRKRCRLEEGHDFATCECEYKVPETLSTDAAQAGSDTLSLYSGAVPMGDGTKIALKSRSSNWDPHAPFIVARASGDIISQHSDIYTPRFITFLTAYVSEFLQQARDVDAGGKSDPCAAPSAPAAP